MILRSVSRRVISFTVFDKRSFKRRPVKKRSNFTGGKITVYCVFVGSGDGFWVGLIVIVGNVEGASVGSSGGK